MLAAVRKGDALVAPTVGTWFPRVVRGACIERDTLLGVLVRAGREFEVVAPPEALGRAETIAPGKTWVEYGTLLVGLAADRGIGERAPDAVAACAIPEGRVAVAAPSDGILYLSGQAGGPRLAPIGARVSRAQTLALIEVMKTFAPVRSPVDGIVERVLGHDASAVKGGEPLFLLRVS